ncbi:hypothetical protein DXG01_008767, partial [Tephrocybe rancida]
SPFVKKDFSGRYPVSCAQRTVAEKAAQKKTPASAKYNNPVVLIRVLGWFLKDFWDHLQDGYLGSVPYNRILEEVLSCNQEIEQTEAQLYENLCTLGGMYQGCLMRVFRSNAGPMPTPSTHVSRPSFDKLQKDIARLLGRADPTLPNAKKQEYAATAFAILDMFGIGDNVRALYGGEVNGLHNVITLSQDLHSEFDTFQFWLEPVPGGQKHTYNVCSSLPLTDYVIPLPKRVTFRVDPAAAALIEEQNEQLGPGEEKKRLDLPDPTLIAIRAACARVARMSGAAAQADKILTDIEDTSVLAGDGSTAELFSSYLDVKFMHHEPTM